MTSPYLRDGSSNQEVVRVVQEISRRVDRLERSLAQNRLQEFDVSNSTETRNYDANATSVAELADVLGTLIQQLQGTR